MLSKKKKNLFSSVIGDQIYLILQLLEITTKYLSVVYCCGGKNTKNTSGGETAKQ